MIQAGPELARARVHRPHPFTVALLRALAFDTILATTAAAGFGCGLVLAFIVIGGMR